MSWSEEVGSDALAGIEGGVLAVLRRRGDLMRYTKRFCCCVIPTTRG